MVTRIVNQSRFVSSTWKLVCFLSTLVFEFGRSAEVVGRASVFQPAANRECVQVMGVGTTLYAAMSTFQPPSLSLSSTTTKPPLAFRDICAEVCISHETSCVGFNFPPGGAFCVLVAQGCSVTSNPMWTFYRKPKRLLSKAADSVATRSFLNSTLTTLSLEPSSRTTRPVPRGFASLKTIAAGNRHRTEMVPAIDSDFIPINITINDTFLGGESRSLELGEFYDVFRGTLCKMSLRDMLFTVTTTGVAGCAEACLNYSTSLLLLPTAASSSSTCFGFNMPAVSEDSKEDKSPFCELLLRDDCQASAERGWYYFRRKLFSESELNQTLIVESGLTGSTTIGYVTSSSTTTKAPPLITTSQLSSAGENSTIQPFDTITIAVGNGTGHEQEVAATTTGLARTTMQPQLTSILELGTGSGLGPTGSTSTTTPSSSGSTTLPTDTDDDTEPDEAGNFTTTTAKTGSSGRSRRTRSTRATTLVPLITIASQLGGSTTGSSSTVTAITTETSSRLTMTTSSKTEPPTSTTTSRVEPPIVIGSGSSSSATLSERRTSTSPITPTGKTEPVNSARTSTTTVRRSTSSQMTVSFSGSTAKPPSSSTATPATATTTHTELATKTTSEIRTASVLTPIADNSTAEKGSTGTTLAPTQATRFLSSIGTTEEEASSSTVAPTSSHEVGTKTTRRWKTRRTKSTKAPSTLTSTPWGQATSSQATDLATSTSSSSPQNTKTTRRWRTKWPTKSSTTSFTESPVIKVSQTTATTNHTQLLVEGTLITKIASTASISSSPSSTTAVTVVVVEASRTGRPATARPEATNDGSAGTRVPIDGSTFSGRATDVTPTKSGSNVEPLSSSTKSPVNLLETTLASTSDTSTEASDESSDGTSTMEPRRSPRTRRTRRPTTPKMWTTPTGSVENVSDDGTTSSWGRTSPRMTPRTRRPFGTDFTSLHETTLANHHGERDNETETETDEPTVVYSLEPTMQPTEEPHVTPNQTRPQSTTSRPIRSTTKRVLVTVTTARMKNETNATQLASPQTKGSTSNFSSKPEFSLNQLSLMAGLAFLSVLLLANKPT